MAAKVVKPPIISVLMVVPCSWSLKRRSNTLLDMQFSLYVESIFIIATLKIVQSVYFTVPFWAYLLQMLTAALVDIVCVAIIWPISQFIGAICATVIIARCRFVSRTPAKECISLASTFTSFMYRAWYCAKIHNNNQEIARFWALHALLWCNVFSVRRGPCRFHH